MKLLIIVYTLFFLVILTGCGDSAQVDYSFPVLPCPEIPVDSQGLATAVPLDNTYTLCTRAVILKKTLHVRKGDVILIVAQDEVTNNTGGTVGVGRYLARNSPDAPVNSPVMDNVTPEMHHKVLQLVTIDTVTETGDVTYEFVVYAVGWYNTQEWLRVEPNYGYIVTVVLNRGEE